MRVDLLIHSAAQLLTVASDGPKGGAAMRDLGLIEDGAMAVKDGRIALVGETRHVRAQVVAGEEVDASGKVVMPGFVDAHTHLVFAGDRAGEFEQRVGGATYLEIMAAGGGIMSTVRATRAASVEQLVEESRARLDRMLAHGTTTAEVKTGYGLTTADELKMLEAIARLDAEHPVDLVPTFLGAHAVPEEYKGRADEYVDLVVEEMLPAVTSDQGQGARDKELGTRDKGGFVPSPLSLVTSHSLPFCDVFCDEGAFTLAQSRRVLERAKELGFPLKIHADEFAALGGTALAAELGAVSADHLAATPDEELALLADAGTIPVLLPGTTFGLGSPHYADARKMIDRFALPVALATDLNPGTCWCESMPFIIALACRYLRMTPAEAIVAATLNAAHALGLGATVGSLEVGKNADLILLDTADYCHLAYRFGTNPVALVIKAGRVVWRQRGLPCRA